MHGLLQAFSRTNRILNSIKTFGNIVCFRPLQKRVDERLYFIKTATELHNFVRALNPSPLANILVNGEEWKVLTTEVGDSVNGKLGEVVEVNKDSFVAACKDSSLIVKKITPAGKKEMFVKDFFNGFNKESLKGVVLNEER